MSGHQKGTCYDEIGLCDPNKYIILGTRRWKSTWRKVDVHSNKVNEPHDDEH
jgi:hypothetical protein